MSYSELIQKLFSVNLFGGVKLGLEVCRKINALLGHPDKAYEIIHVAGTNGKGSVTKKISAALQHAGYRTGLYTSPHISCFRERICVNGQMISESDVCKLLENIFELCSNNNLKPTFFEITTLLALDYFARQKVDFVVLETGLGGRLDATNIVNPKLSAITSVSLEHTEILGKTVEEIAIEKAGIIKNGAPVVLGPRLPRQLLCEIASSRKSPCILVQGSFSTFDEENNAIAQAAIQFLELPEAAVKAGLSAHMPCRFELFTPASGPAEDVILDVAHNPDGLQQLFKAIHQKFAHKPLRIICGLSKTKDIPGCLSIIAKQAKHIHLVEAPNGRGVSPEELRKILAELNYSENEISIDSSIEKAVKHALSEAASQKQVLIACGSFFIMSEIRSALGIHEPTDTIDLNERWSNRSLTGYPG